LDKQADPARCSAHYYASLYAGLFAQPAGLQGAWPRDDLLTIVCDSNM